LVSVSFAFLVTQTIPGLAGVNIVNNTDFAAKIVPYTLELSGGYLSSICIITYAYDPVKKYTAEFHENG
jgi:hypothetical protein